MKSKKLLSLACAATMALTLVACGGGSSSSNSAASSSGNAGGSGDKIKIGCTVDELNEFMTYCVEGAEQYCEENGIEIDIVSAEFDVTQQISQVEDFIAAGCDGVMVKPCDSDSCQPMVDACREAGIPIIAFNNPMTADADAFVGSDHKSSGYKNAKAICEQLNGEGKVMILQGAMQQTPAQDRDEGMQEAIAEFPGIELVDAQDTQWARDEAISITENWIQSGKEFDAIIASSSEPAVGAVIALQDSGYEMGEVLVGAIDAQLADLEMMQKGWISFGVFQPAPGQGYHGAETLHKLIKGESVEKYVDVPYEDVTMDNIEDFLKLYE